MTPANLIALARHRVGSHPERLLGAYEVDRAIPVGEPSNGALLLRLAADLEQRIADDEMRPDVDPDEAARIVASRVTWPSLHWRGWDDPEAQHALARAIVEAMRPTSAAAIWDEAAQALAWAIENGPSADAAAYVAENNPYR